MNSNEYLYIVALGGITFNAYLIEDYDPSMRPGLQPCKWLGWTDFGDLDTEGQFIQTDEEIIEHVRREYDVSENIPAGVW